MSKKILKRSLALGALMTFVITGNVWADITDGYDFSDKTAVIKVYSGNKLEISGETISRMKPNGNSVIHTDGEVSISGTTFSSNVGATQRANKLLNIPEIKRNGIIYVVGGTLKLTGDVVFERSNSGNYINNTGNGTVEISGTGNKFLNSTSRGIYNYGDLVFKDGSETLFTTGPGGCDITNREGGRVVVKKDATVTFEGKGIDFEVQKPEEGLTSIDDVGYVDIEGTISGNISGHNYINFKGGTLNGKMSGGQNTSEKSTGFCEVEFNGGTWNLKDKSIVETMGGNGTLKVDLTTGEQVKVLSINSATKAGEYDFSKINIDHGGVVGVDVEQGVQNFYKTIVDVNGKSLIKDKNVGDVFLQATVTNGFDDSGNITDVTTTIKPGDDFVIESDVVANSFNGVKIEDLAKTEYVNTELAKKADKSYLDDELAKKADITYVDTVVSNAVSGKVDQTYVDAELNQKADKATTLAGYGITDAYTKGEVNAELDKKANQADVETVLDLKADKTALEAEATTREKADVGLQEQINNLSTGSNAAIDGINQRLGKMNGKINKVGAGAAALAALHPLDYDPDDKLTFSAGVGNYAGENAAALGAFYRPDEKLMFSLGGTMGNGENMVNLGVSIGLDGANGTPKLSRKELVQKVSAMEVENQSMKAENKAIKAENENIKKEVAELKALVAELLAKK